MNRDEQIASKNEVEEIDLIHIITKMLDHWRLILWGTVLCTSLSIVWAVISKPIYQGDILIQVENKQGKLLSGGLRSIMPELNSGVASEIQLLQSRMVLSKTVNDLNLQAVITPARGTVLNVITSLLTDKKSGAIMVDALSAPAGASFILTVENNAHFSIVLGDDRLEGVVGEKLVKGDFSILISALKASPGESFSVKMITEQEAVLALKKSLAVSEIQKDSGMLSVVMTDSNPLKISLVLDQLADNYLQQNISRQAEKEARSLEFLQKLLPEIQHSLNEAEEKLNAYRQKRDSVDLNLEAKSVLEQIVNVDNQLNMLTFQEAEISQLYKKEHPSYRALQDKRNVLEKEKGRLGQRVSAMPSVQQEVLRLSRDVEAGRTVYMQLLSLQQELNITHSGITGNVRIIDTAVVQSEPVKPKKGIIIILGFLSGLMLSSGIVIVRASLHRGIESPEQLEQRGLLVYASVPQSRWLQTANQKLPWYRCGPGKRQREKRISFLATEKPDDFSVEAIRNLRTSLRFEMKASSRNVLVFTSPTPDSGKTFVSSMVAATMAQSGLKVLFIDADLRRGDAHTLFGMEHGEGMVSVLSGKQKVQSVVQPFLQGGFDVITRGAGMSDPSELLMDDCFSATVNWARQSYDVVIIDTPPVLAVSDATIAGRVDSLLFVVARAGLNSVKETTVCIQKLERASLSVRGVILNGVIKRTSSFYRDGYYSEGYRYT